LELGASSTGVLALGPGLDSLASLVLSSRLPCRPPNADRGTLASASFTTPVQSTAPLAQPFVSADIAPSSGYDNAWKHGEHGNHQEQGSGHQERPAVTMEQRDLHCFPGVGCAHQTSSLSPL
jgi:hypothetical protein